MTVQVFSKADFREPPTDCRWPQADSNLQMRTRAMPHVGEPVTIVFLAASVSGIIEGVEARERGSDQ
jgi:hypothetical protein